MQRAKPPAGAPFERYEVDAPTPEMKEFARVAKLRGLSQEQLAKLYVAEVGGFASGANVMRHFMAKRPAVDTVDAYRRILRVTPEHLSLAAGTLLDRQRARAAMREIDDELRLFIEAAAATKARDAVRALPAEEQVRAVSAYTLGKHRSHHAPRVGGGLSLGLVELQPFLPTVDLAASRHVHDPTDSFLTSILVAARGVLKNQADVDALLHFARTLAQAEGINTRSMDERLDRALRSKRSHFMTVAQQSKRRKRK